MELAFFSAADGPGGYLLSTGSINNFIEHVYPTVLNIRFKYALETMPAIGLSILSSTAARQSNYAFPSDAAKLDDNFSVNCWQSADKPDWAYHGVKEGDRLRVRFARIDAGRYTMQFKLNRLAPTQAFDIILRKDIHLFLIVQASAADAMKVFTEEQLLQLMVPPRRFPRVGNGTVDFPPTCIGCMDEAVSVMANPCHHMMCCESCFEKAPDDMKRKCWICRSIALSPVLVGMRGRPDHCLFDDCGTIDAVALPCACLVGCYAKAKGDNNFRNTGKPQPICRNCLKPVNCYVQVYWAGQENTQ